MARKEDIQLTRPYLPPLNEFIPLLEQIWESQWLTNSGQFHKKLEDRLSSYLGVGNCSLISNGTLALMVALKALGLQGEVITTPFTFPATTNALHWLGLKPVFVDIDPITLNIDPQSALKAISRETSAILGVHVFGVPCDVESISAIAHEHKLKVIYDAAHAFGVKVADKSVLQFGHASILSFHATKVFTTFEGGAVVTPSEDIKRNVDKWKNFGIEDEVTVSLPGLNAKMNEVQAAFGLLQLNHIEDSIQSRLSVARYYDDRLANARGLELPNLPSNLTWNGSYYPIRVLPGFRCNRDSLYHQLRANGILARRYFYPLTSSMPMYAALPSADRSNLPVANRIATEILCLPIYSSLTRSLQDKVISTILGV